MEKSTVSNGNKKVAVFMGWDIETDDMGIWGTKVPSEYLIDDSMNWYSSEDLLFHKNWNWLMSVIEKISDIKSWSINATMEWLSENQDRDGLYDVKDTFEAVVEAIK